MDYCAGAGVITTCLSVAIHNDLLTTTAHSFAKILLLILYYMLKRIPSHPFTAFFTKPNEIGKLCLSLT